MSVISAIRGVTGLLSVVFVGFACQSVADIPEDIRYSPQCEDYCAEIRTQCNGASIAQYPNDETCFAACQAIGERARFAEADNSNTVFCRTLKAEQIANAPGDKPELCSAAGPGGNVDCTDSPDDPYCEGYCTLYVSACNGKSSNPFKARQEFMIPGTDAVENISDCIDACRAVPPIPAPGYAFGDSESGDTLACRLHWATIAAQNPSEQNCIRAGLRPQGNCETDTPGCDNFCRTAMVACPSSWDDLDHCVTTCEATEQLTDTDDEAKDLVGADSIKCRDTHAFVALLVNPDHCAHAGVLGSNVCGGNCDAYCRLAQAACPGREDDDFFEAPEEDAKSPCVEECEALDRVMSHDARDYTVESGESGNSVQCRALQASRALNEELSEEDKAALCDAAFGGDPCN